MIVNLEVKNKRCLIYHPSIRSSKVWYRRKKEGTQERKTDKLRSVSWKEKSGDHRAV